MLRAVLWKKEGGSAKMEITGTPGEIYEQHIVPAIVARWAPELVEVVGVRPGERVLDLACGTGIVTRLLADRVGPAGRVVGLDVNASMLAAARIAVTSPQIEWLEGNAMSIPLPDAAFDAVVCQQGFQFFPDKLVALHEMRRVLVPGGRLVLSVWRSIEHAPGFRVLEEALARRIGAAQATLPPFSLGDGQAIRARSYWIPGSYAPPWSEKRTSLFKAIEKEGLQGGKGYRFDEPSTPIIKTSAFQKNLV
jgi:SAM-dependent methyltransferase